MTTLLLNITRHDELPRCLRSRGRRAVVALYNYIAKAASPDIAKRYTDGILSYCESFQSFPNRGYLRNDIRPGLRITHYKKRTIIAFQVGDERVSVLGVFYGGQDYETLLHDEPEDSRQSD